MIKNGHRTVQQTVSNFSAYSIVIFIISFPEIVTAMCVMIAAIGMEYW